MRILAGCAVCLQGCLAMKLQPGISMSGAASRVQLPNCCCTGQAHMQLTVHLSPWITDKEIHLRG